MKGGEGREKGRVPRLLRFHPDLGVPDQGVIYMENSVSTARPAHSAVMSRPGLYLVEGKAAREWLAIGLLMPGLEMEGR